MGSKISLASGSGRQRESNNRYKTRYKYPARKEIPKKQVRKGLMDTDIYLPSISAFLLSIISLNFSSFAGSVSALMREAIREEWEASPMISL